MRAFLLTVCLWCPSAYAAEVVLTIPDGSLRYYLHEACQRFACPPDVDEARYVAEKFLPLVSLGGLSTLDEAGLDVEIRWDE